MTRATSCYSNRLPGRLATIVICAAVILLLLAVAQPAVAATSKAAANLDQCRNGPVGGEVPCAGPAWVNGNAGASNAHYQEGDSISYRMVMTGFAAASSHTLVIQWDTTKGSKHALDYITSWDRTVLTGSDACSDVTGAVCDSPNTTTFAIPLSSDPMVPSASAYPYALPLTLPVSENFTMYGGAIASVGFGSFGGWTGDTSQLITIVFTANNPTVILAWGGHIAKRQEWGAPIITGGTPTYDGIPYTGTAANITGSPYHMRLVSLDGAGGNQDRSLSAAAVTSPSQITIAKNAGSDTTTSFSFTASPSPLTDFPLTGGTNTTFGSITTFTTYSVAESVPTNWQINTAAAGGGIDCSLSNISLDYGTNIFTKNISSASVSIALGEGDDATCTFYDKQTIGTLEVKKSLSPTSDSGLFNLQIGGVTAGTGANVGNGGTTGAISETTGNYTVGETAGTGTTLSNYTSSISCTDGTTTVSGTGTTLSNVPVSNGKAMVCTITNTRKTLTLKILKSLSPTTDAGRFDLSIGGTVVKSSAGDGGYGTATVNVADSVTVSEAASGSTTLAYYTSALACDNSVTPSPNTGTSGTFTVPDVAGPVTCTFTNTRKSLSLVVKKALSPTTDAGRFDLSIGANVVMPSAGNGDSGSATVYVGDSVNISEAASSGTTGAWYSSVLACNNSVTPSSNTGTSGTVSVPNNIAGPVTCTFTNTRRTLSLVVKKTLSPATDTGTFDLSIGGSVVASAVGNNGSGSATVNVGDSVSVSEAGSGGTTLTSYSSALACDSSVTPSSNTGTSGTVTVPNTAGPVTCTFTNTHLGHIVVQKVTDPASDTTTLFTFTPSYNSGTTFQLKNGGSNDSGGLTAGTYSVSESTLTGWNQTSASCVDGTTTGINPSSINLQNGHTVTCTFTNTKQASLQVVKNTTGANGTFNFTSTGGLPGTGTGGSFSLDTGSSYTKSVTFSNITPGSYSVTETVLTGWTLSSSSCTQNGSGSFIPKNGFTVAAGDVWVCTFNNYAPANLSILKTAGASKINPGGTASYTITVTNTGPGSATGITVTDTLPSGVGNWSVYGTPSGGLSCSITGTPATSLSCTLTTLGVGSASVTVQATVPSTYLLPPSLPAASSSLDDFQINGDLSAATGTDWATLATENLIKCIAPNDPGNIGCELDLPSGQQDNSFGNGTKEDTAVPQVVTGSIPNNKSDLTRLYLASRAVTDGATLSNFLYIAWEREQAPKGSTDMDFELNQSTTMSANGQTPVRTGGDLLITYDLASGGTVPVLGYHHWVDSAYAAIHYPGQSASQVCAASSSFPCWDVGSSFPSNLDIDGAVNTVSVTDPIAPNADQTLGPLTFGEVRVNLQAVGIFQTNLSDPSQCTTYGQAYLKSRSSTSFTAAMKDFIEPVKVSVSNCPDKSLTNQASFTADGFTTPILSGTVGITVTAGSTTP